MTLVLSAAGFMATRTSGWSPGVWMSLLEKLSWKPLTPGSEPAGARISAGKSGRVLMSLPKTAGRARELGPGQLHAVAGVAGEPDGHAVQLLDRRRRLRRQLGRHAPSCSSMR